MKPYFPIMKCALALLVGGVLAAGPVLADKPSSAGKGKDKDEHYKDYHQKDKGHGKAGKRAHFEDRHRVIVREYYVEHYHGDRCPPGLKKKHNGCMPPGKAKKWEYGRVLPSDVVYYEVPHRLVVQIGVPPPGYQYVRVASDILMIAVGTRMVVDAIADLGR